ncbi:MAG: PAS domain-containing protein [bacterium]
MHKLEREGALASLLDSIFRFPGDAVTTSDHVAHVLNLIDLPILVVDKAFKPRLVNREGEELLKRQSIVFGDRSRRGNCAAFKALMKPEVIAALRHGKARLVPPVPPPDPADAGMRTVVCPGRIQGADLAFLVAFPNCTAEDFDLNAAVQWLFEGFRFGALMIGADLTHRIFNQRGLDIFRLKADEALGKRTSEINPSRQAKVLEEQFSHMIRHGETRIEEAYPVASAKLGVIRSRLMAWPVWTRDGEPEGLVVLIDPLPAQPPASMPDSKTLEMLGREGYLHGPPIFCTHVDGKISVMTAAANALVAGGPAGRTVNFKTDLRWVNPQIVQGLYDDLLRGARSVTAMADLDTPGGRKPMRIAGHGVRDLGEIVSQAMFVLADASEYESTRKMLADTVRTLAAEKDILERAMECLDMPIAIVGGDLKIISVNAALARRLNISPAQAAGKHLSDVIGTADRTGMTAVFRNVIEQETEVHLPRFNHIMRDGRVMPMEVAVYPIRVEGKPCGLAVARELVEIENLEVEAAKWSGLFGALASDAWDGVVVLDRDGVVTHVNPVIVATFQTGNRLVGRSYSDLLSAEERKPLRTMVERVLRSGERASTGPVRIHKKDTNEEISLDLDLVPLADRRGAVDGLIAILHFTTRAVRLERELERHSQNLEKLVAERTEEISAANRLLANTVSRMTAVAKSCAVLGSARSVESLYEVFLEQVAGIVGTTYASLAVVESRDGTAGITSRHVGEPPPSGSEVSGAVETDLADAVSGKDREPLRQPRPDLMLADIDLGEARGVLAVWRGDGEFSSVDSSLVGLLASHLASALPATRYLVGLRSSRDRADCLRRIAMGVAGASSADRAIESVAQELAGVLAVDRFLWMVAGRQSELWVREIFSQSGVAGASAARVLTRQLFNPDHARAVSMARGRSFCEMLDGSGPEAPPAQRGTASEAGPEPHQGCPFGGRASRGEVAAKVRAVLERAGMLQESSRALVVAPVMLSEGSWSLLCAEGADGARLSRDDTCFMCVAASMIGYVWRTADAASSVRRLEAAGETVSDIVHDLKYPLNKIRATLAGARSAAEGDAGGSRAISVVASEIEKLAALAQELAEVSNPAGRKPEILDAREITAHCIDLISGDLGKRQGEIRNEIGVVPPIFADRRDVTRALLNVLSNGVEAAAADGAVTITARVMEPRPGLRMVGLVFEDSGPGVPPGEVDRVFDAFYSTKEGGQGLGLFSAKKRARASGGDVTCEIGPGGRSRFVVAFPTVVG